jgi:nitrogen-specific signal transduction histidine kinase/CheY-like chemotaxis protein
MLEKEDKQALELKMLRFQKMEAIGELAGGIAHDFNNILTSVMGYTELALMEAPANGRSKLSTYLQEVYQGGRRARELVSKMLTFSRTDKSEPHNLDLMLEIKEIVKMLRASLPRSIEIRIDIDEGLPEVFIDQQFLQQMVMNACINARDAMPDGGTIHMRGRTRSISRVHCDSCHADFAGDYVEFSIEDTGTGISADLLDRIFEPYVSTKDNGSGMGLAMVHGIVHRQGGHIKVDSIVNDGTELRFFLKSADAITNTVAERPFTQIEPTRLEDKHILVVDDEVSLVYFIRELLQRKGYQVTVASDSHEAWDIFSSNPDQFDMVVTDQTMPGLSGVQLAGKMITLKPNLPIMLCTGYSDVVDETNIAQYGIQSFMPKPLDSKEFLQSVEELLLNKRDSE